MYQKKSWTSYEDDIIRKYVQQMGQRPKWKSIAEKLNQSLPHNDTTNRRTPKQCRQRWHNKLDPQILDKQWDQIQINKLFQLHNEHGNKWSLIATMMNGRTDNCVKNKFYSALRKGMRKINKYIVNLKRKLLVNKNICIKQFKDVVLTKLIAVADRKYKDKLDVKENSQSKTQKLSEAIKLALVTISSNEDDYVGHVENGIADDDYTIQQSLFKNIQQFCRNCKRKKGKRKDSDNDEQIVSQMIEQQSQQITIQQQKPHKKILQQKVSNIKHISNPQQDITSIKTSKPKQIIKPLSPNSIIDNLIIDERSVHNNNSSIFDDLIEGNSNNFYPYSIKPLHQQQPKTSQSYFPPPQFSTINNNTTINNNQSWLTLSAQQNKFLTTTAVNDDGLVFKEIHINKTSIIDDSDFLKSIRCVGEPTVQYQKTDNNHNHNNSSPQEFRIQQIFFQCPQINPLQTSNNNLSNLASSNNNFFGERSASLGFLNRSRTIQNPFDINPANVYISSSYSSSSNKQVMEILQSLQKNQKSQKKEDNNNLQRSHNFQITSSYQLEDLLRRASERP